MRILISASSLSPYAGSEPGVGWNIVSRLAMRYETHILTRPIAFGKPNSDYRSDVEHYFESHPAIPNLHVHWIPCSRYSKLIEGSLLRHLFYYQGYGAWQHDVLRFAERLHKEQSFDLVHQLTITGYREPGYLWKLPVPFVWGPITGAQMIPKAFLQIMRRRGMVFYGLRNLVNRWQMKRSGRWRTAAIKASHIWTAAPEDYRMVTKHWECQADPMIETGATPWPNKAPRTRRANQQLELVWSGGHIGLKALPLVLYALARLSWLDRIRLTILGEGGETRAWQELARKLGISEALHWTGRLPHREALEQMDQAHVLVFSSVKEGTSSVVLESLALGLPVICHDACGMGTAVNDACGIKIPMIDPETSIREFSVAIRRFLDEPQLLERLSRSALMRATELTWDKKVERMCEVYEAIV